MSMTKKDFVALADAIRAHNKYYAGSPDADNFFDCHLNTLADFCKRQNVDFKRERWLGYIAGTTVKNGGTR